MSEKCDTCMLRYPCDEQTEWECKHNGYRHYKPDTSKIEMLDRRALTINQGSPHQNGQKEDNMKELKDTIDLMTSADYKDRFRAEYWQTLLRAHKLQTLLQKHKDGTLKFTPDCPIELLHIQLSYMGNYLNVLRERAAIEGVKLEWHKQEEVKEETVLPGLVLNKKNLSFLIGALASYIWKMEDQGRDMLPGAGYTDRVILLADLKEFEARVFPERNCCG